MNEATKKAIVEAAKIWEQMKKNHEAEMARSAWERS